MADWVYIAGEDKYVQPFEFVDPASGDGFNGTGFTTATLFIISSDFATKFPNAGTGKTGTITSNDPLAVDFNVDIADMPQSEAMYLYTWQFKDASGQVRHSFEGNLNVQRNLTT